MPVPAMIHAQGLVKSFGRVRALAGLDLAVPAGTTMCLLGQNGAGKTTAVRVLTTLLRPDAGTALVAGHDVVADGAAVRRSIGLAGQHTSVDECLTGRANLIMLGRLSRLGRRQARFFGPGRIQFRQRRVAGHRRRVAHRARQHFAHAVAERGDIHARARKSGRAAFGRASTKHAE